MKPKISVVIPIFNGEPYLRRCLESIVSAARDKPIEVILVDDGSVDATPEIALEYVERYGWIRYFRQDNQGPSAARNYGLAQITGEYISFVDCDDCVSSDYFATLINASLSRPDIVVFGYIAS